MLGTIVIADDATFMRMIIRDIAKSMGLEVVAEAKDGAEAVSFYNEYKPDIITLDLIMPDVDGLSALGKIMESDPYANVVICTVSGQKEMVMSALEMGAKDFIVKPLTEARVVRSFQQIIHRRGSGKILTAL